MSRSPVRRLATLLAIIATTAASLALVAVASEPVAAAGLSETLDVPATSPDGATTAHVFQAGTPYEVVVSGAYLFQKNGFAGMHGLGPFTFWTARGDAECTVMDPDKTWQPERFRLLDPANDPSDLYIDGQNVTWTPFNADSLGCDPDNRYRHIYVPTETGPIHFNIHEPGPTWWGDNLGKLTVTVRELPSVFDSFEIPANLPNGVLSNATLQSGVTYEIEVSGTYTPDGSNLRELMTADAECTQHAGGPGVTEHPNNTIWGDTDLYDVRVDHVNVSWNPANGATGCDDTTHTYTIRYTPDSNRRVRLSVYDSFMNDNGGSLQAKIRIVADGDEGSAAAALPQLQLVETVIVDSTKPEGENSKLPLIAGDTYLMEVSGQYGWGFGGADAECSSSLLEPDVWLRNRFESHPAGRDTDLLDLMINNRIVEWTPTVPNPDGCNPVDHTYRFLYNAPSTGLANFRLKTTTTYYNFGNLEVRIFRAAEVLMGVVQVATNSPDGTVTPPVLAGHNYRLAATGTWSWVTGSPLYLADAECSRSNTTPWVENAFAGNPAWAAYPDLLDLTVNGAVHNWKPSNAVEGCDPLHEYELLWKAPSTGVAKLAVIDGYYPDNSGSMRVFLYKRLD